MTPTHRIVSSGGRHDGRHFKSCLKCQDCLWVCENHNDKPWFGIVGGTECCGGAGELCECAKPQVSIEQVTRRQLESENLPAPFDDYFWVEKVGTGLSHELCTFGYQESIKVGPGHFKVKWVPIKETP